MREERGNEEQRYRGKGEEKVLGSNVSILKRRQKYEHLCTTDGSNVSILKCNLLLKHVHIQF